MSHRDEKCGHCSVAKSTQWSQHFILPNSAYLLGTKHKGGGKSIPKSEFGKTQAVHTEGKEGENWLTNYSWKVEDLNLCVAK